MHDGYALSALSQALFDHIVLYECVYLMPQSKTHVVSGLQLSVDCFGENPLQCCVVRLLLWPVCMLQTGQRSRHKVLSCGGITNDEGHSLWLPFFFSFAMLCCMFLVLFTACLTNWQI